MRTQIALLVLVAAMVTGGHTTGYAQAAPSGQSLEGAWNVKVEFDTPGVEGCTSPSLMMRDGGIMAAGCSLAESPGYGKWARTGDHTFASTFVGQGFDLTTGAINSTYKVRAALRLSADQQRFSGPFVTDIFAPDGTWVFTASGIVTADRVTVEPLP